MVQLGSSSKPATVSIGGSSGKTTTTPAKSSSSTSSTAQKLSSLEKTLAPATQAKAPAPAPAPAYINPYDKPISQTPAAQQVIKPTPPPAEYNLPSTPPPAPTPAQAIQQSIASGTNVPISAQTLAARNEGLKPLSAPIPTTGLGSKVAVVATGGALKGGIAALTEPEPVKTIKYVPITAPTYSLQETLAISEAMKKQPN